MSPGKSAGNSDNWIRIRTIELFVEPNAVGKLQVEQIESWGNKKSCTNKETANFAKSDCVNLSSFIKSPCTFEPRCHRKHSNSF